MPETGPVSPVVTPVIYTCIMASDNTKKMILQSSLGEMDKLDTFVNELQEWASLDQQQRDRIMLPLSEAINNAILHGNKLQEHKPVTIVAELRNQRLTVSVKDEGAGFDPDEVPDPLKKENLLKEGGRGIYLIREYADDIDFQNNGSKIVMHFML